MPTIRSTFPWAAWGFCGWIDVTTGERTPIERPAANEEWTA